MNRVPSILIIVTLVITIAVGSDVNPIELNRIRLLIVAVICYSRGIGMTGREIVNKARRREISIFEFFSHYAIDGTPHDEFGAQLDELVPLVRADERIKTLKEVYAWLSKETTICGCLNESDWETLKQGEMPNNIPTK